MKFNYSLLLVLVLACGSAVAASDWVEQIGAVVPGNITLTEAEEADGYVNMVGQAKSNKDISNLIRAIDSAGLGSPELQQIKRDGDISNFVLRVKARR